MRSIVPGATPMHGEPARCATLFCRVSSLEQTKGGSQQTQQRLGLEYAAQRGLTVTRIFQVAETASKRASRVQWDAFLAYVRASPDQHVLVAAVDRALRNYHDLPEVQDLQRRYGKTVHFFLEGLVLDGTQKSTADLRLGIQAAVAVWYAGELSEKVARGMEGKARRGEWPTRAPYGYRNEPLTRRIAPDPAQAPWVRRVLELSAQGLHSLDRIVAAVTAEGCRHLGRPLHRNMVERMIRNPIYAGRVEWPRGSGQLYPGTHEPLVDWEIHTAAVRGLERTDRPRYRKHDYLLAGLARCACGRAVVVEEKKGGRFRYARCTGTRGHACPDARHIPAQRLESQLLAALAAVQISEADAQLVVEDLARDAGAGQADTEAQLALLKRDLARIEQRLARAYEDRLDGAITESFWAERQAAWGRERVRLEEAVRRLEAAGPAAVLPTVRGVLELAKRIVPLYESATVAQKRQILNHVCSNWLLVGEKLDFSYVEPFAPLAEAVQTGKWWAFRDAIRTWARTAPSVVWPA